MLYVITEEGLSEFVKIGFTASPDVNSRLHQLQTGNPRKLVVLAVIPGELADEQKLHHDFAEERVCSGGSEWFLYSGRIQAFVKAGARPEAVDPRPSSERVFGDITQNNVTEQTQSLSKDRAFGEVSENKIEQKPSGIERERHFGKL